MSKNTNVVVYHNDMNIIPLRKFNAIEQDLLFSLCIRMRDENTDTAVMSFEEIKTLCNYTRNSTSLEFATELESVYSKLLSITCRFVENEIIKGFVLFTDYEIDPKKQTVKIRVNDKFSYFLNNITNNFTKFEMLEFGGLSSGYSKTAYRLLKQFRKTGYVIFDIETFRNKFDIPKSYQMSDIDKRVIQPIQRELKPYIKSLEINKLAKDKGRKITHIEFIFMSDSDFKDNGKKTFRDKDGFYYEKSFDELTLEEIDKEYPKAPKPQAKKYFKNI